MDIRVNLGKLNTPQDIERLTSILSEMADSLDTIVSTTAPNGNISGRQGQRCLYNNSGVYTCWINTTGSTVWQQETYTGELWEIDGGDTEMKAADDMDMQNMQIKGMCIENRADDTGCTQTGRIWLRTDV